MNNIGSQGYVKAVGARPLADAPEISQISCLGTVGGVQTHSQQQYEHGDALSFQATASGDWYKDQSNMGQDTPRRTNFRESDSEFVRLSKQGGHEDLLKVSGCNESPFINAKQFSAKKEFMSPSQSTPAGVAHGNMVVAPGNPIWLGGTGPERGFVPGKRFMKHDTKESPFALSEDSARTQSRNPDKI